MPFDLMIESTGKFREVRTHCFISTITTIIIGALLGAWGMTVSPMMALCGAMAGVCCGNIVRIGLQLYFVPKYITHLPVMDSVWRIMRMVFTIAVIALPPILLLPSPQQFRYWLIEAVGLVIWAVAVTGIIALIFDREAMRSLAIRAKHLLRR